jgi:hypothetical protein
MNAVVTCEVVLSKKLEAMCEEGEPVSLQLNGTRGNKARGMLRIVTKPGVGLEDLVDIGETSLMLKTLTADDDVESILDQQRHSSIFTTTDMKGAAPAVAAVAKTDNSSSQGDAHPMSKKPAVPPEEKAMAVSQLRQAEAAKAQAQAAKASAPAQVRQDIDPDVLAKQKKIALLEAQMRKAREELEEAAKPAEPPAVSSYEELVEKLSEVEGIENELPQLPEGRKLSRKEAIRMELSVPRLGVSVYISNELQAQLIIQDIDLSKEASLTLNPGEVYDLSKIPARKVLESNDLKWCIETDKVKFKSRRDYERWFATSAKQTSPMDQSPLPMIDMKARDFAANVETGAISISGMEDSALPAEVDEEGEILYGDDPNMDSLLSSMPSE